jgi:hypothetical protein
MPALEGTEQLFGIGHVKTHPVVPHEVNRFAGAADFMAKRDLGAGLPGAEFPGIAQQVGEHLLEQPRITLREQTCLGMQLCRPARFAFLVVVLQDLCQGAEVYLLP